MNFDEWVAFNCSSSDKFEMMSSPNEKMFNENKNSTMIENSKTENMEF